MPIYGYACKSCEHAFDALQKMSDPLLVECPECAEPSLRKQLSAPKFRLKGKGWYETDFKTGEKKNLAGEAGGTEKSKDAKDTGGKPDKKSDKKSHNKKPPADSKAKSA